MKSSIYLFDQACIFEKMASEPSDEDMVNLILNHLKSGKNVITRQGIMIRRIKPVIVNVGPPWNPTSKECEYVVILPSGHKRFFQHDYQAAEEALKMSKR